MLVRTMMVLIVLVAGSVGVAELTFEKDRAAILSMAGTYAVDFDFEETVVLKQGYEMHEPYHARAGVEWITVVVDLPRRIVLQHLLVSGNDKVIKHWRQDWDYESGELLEFAGNNTWKRRQLELAEATGTWVQRVFQVDDSPRYQGFGKWVHDGKVSYWESNVTWRPLPRREYSNRDDYDILVARNRHTITPGGWVHEQVNDKLVLRDGRREVLAREIGLNVYKQIDGAAAAPAQEWWARQQTYWGDVRESWRTVFEGHATLRLHKKVDGRLLWRSMFELGDESLAMDAGARGAGIDKMIRTYVVQSGGGD